MTCDWGDCDNDAVGWRFWPGPGWTNDPPWLPVCRQHLAREPKDFELAA